LAFNKFKKTITIIAIWAPKFDSLSTIKLLRSFNSQNILPFQFLGEYFPGIFPHYQFVKKNFYSINKKKIIDFKKKILDRADHIICISRNTLDDLIKIYNINIKKTSVIYLGINYLNLSEKNNFKLEYPYILYVGDRLKYKNFKVLIDAYSISKMLSKSFKIVCFGGGKFTKEEIAYFLNRKIDLNNLAYIEGDDQILINLYNHARALIITSLYEGFGMTALEAQYLNCPVLSSSTKVTKEILQESAIYFNSDNIDDVKNILEKYLFSESELYLIKKKGYENSKKFTLQKNAEETIGVYKKLI
jgi:glycosyltransferase involved in cell wall biosynthesis